ncbi:MAG: response regulator [Proteobacteria bacterium]|nr:response regulator [Pseudomonadota bacterium]
MVQRASRKDRPFYVLLIEDNVHHAELLTELLDRHFAPVIIHTVETIEDGLEFATQSSYDLILTGAVIGEEQITDAIPRLNGLARATPIIVISGRGDEMLAAEIIKRGASEYLVKTQETLEALPSLISRHMASAGSRRRRPAKGASLPGNRLPSPAEIVREVDKLTQQALAIVGPRRRRRNRSTASNEDLDGLLAQIKRLRQLASKLTHKQ